MWGEVTRLDLRLRRVSLLAYSVGFLLYAVLIVVLYPTFRHDTSFDDLLASNPTLSALFGLTGSLTSPTGWMNANLYANFVPLFALLITISYGASAIAGQDEDGTLGGVASLPLTRGRMLAEKTSALALLALPIPVVTLIAAVIGRGFDLDLGVGALVQTTAVTAVMAFDLGLVALAVGTWTGSRGTALGVSVAVAAVAYVISSLAPVVHIAHALRYVSPIYWSVGAGQLSDGADALGAVLAVVVGVVMYGVAWRGFRRLDIH